MIKSCVNLSKNNPYAWREAMVHSCSFFFNLIFLLVYLFLYNIIEY